MFGSFARYLTPHSTAAASAPSNADTTGHRQPQRCSIRSFDDFRLETMLLAPLGGGAMIAVQSFGHGPCVRRRAA